MQRLPQIRIQARVLDRQRGRAQEQADALSVAGGVEAGLGLLEHDEGHHPIAPCDDRAAQPRAGQCRGELGRPVGVGIDVGDGQRLTGGGEAAQHGHTLDVERHQVAGRLAVARVEILGSAQLHGAGVAMLDQHQTHDVVGHEPRDLLEQAVEHDVEVEGRTEDVADLPEHLGFLARVALRRQQPRVLDRQRGLNAERFEQTLVVFAECVDRVAQHADRAEPALLRLHRGHEQRTNRRHAPERDVTRVAADVADVDRHALAHDPPRHALTRPHGDLAPAGLVVSGHRRRPQRRGVLIDEVDDGALSFGDDLSGGVDDHAQDVVEVVGLVERLADDGQRFRLLQLPLDLRLGPASRRDVFDDAGDAGDTTAGIGLERGAQADPQPSVVRRATDHFVVAHATLPLQRAIKGLVLFRLDGEAAVGHGRAGEAFGRGLVTQHPGQCGVDVHQAPVGRRHEDALRRDVGQCVERHWARRDIGRRGGLIGGIGESRGKAVHILGYGRSLRQAAPQKASGLRSLARAPKRRNSTNQAKQTASSPVPQYTNRAADQGRGVGASTGSPRA